MVVTAPKKPAVTAKAPAPEPGVQVPIGGAVRLNCTWRDHSETLKDRFGDFELELFRIDADADIDNVLLSAQFRWYNDFEAIHHAWAGYQITPEWQIQAGIHQDPFGILPYASHSFWFSGAYYMGFEDDYDTGIKLLYEKQPWDFQLAFYKNAEYANSRRYDRYSFNLATGGDRANEEINQFNLRGAYRFNHSSGSYTTAGLSAEWGELYNQITGRHGDRHALAAHVDGHWGPWNFQLELIDYRFSPDNPPGVGNEVIQLTAFDFPFLMAAEARVVTLNLARSFNVDWGRSAISPATTITPGFSRR